MYLAQNLKYLREQKGLSQRDFSADLGLSCAAIGMWEHNHRKPDIEMIIRLAEYFGVTLDDLVLRDLKPPIPKYAGNIRYLRLSHGITQEQIGELLGLKNKSRDFSFTWNGDKMTCTFKIKGIGWDEPFKITI